MLKIESLNREVEMLEKTRKMTREINACLFKWVIIKWLQNISSPEDMDLDIPFENIEASNELSVKLLFWLSQDEIDKLNDKDFTLLLEETSKKK